MRNYVHAKHFINVFHNRETKETKNISHNPEKWSCDSVRWTFMAAFDLYWAKMRIMVLFKSFVKH